MVDPEFCDHCADEVTPGTRHVVEELPINVISADEGESAVLCSTCYRAMLECDRTVLAAFIAFQRVATRHGPGPGQPDA